MIMLTARDNVHPNLNKQARSWPHLLPPRLHAHPPSPIRLRTLPTELGGLNELQTLLVNSNKLCSDIPTELAKLVNETPSFSVDYSDNHIGTACCVALDGPTWTCEPTVMPTMEIRPSMLPTLQPTLLVYCDGSDQTNIKCAPGVADDDGQVSADCRSTWHDLACRSRRWVGLVG